MGKVKMARGSYGGRTARGFVETGEGPIPHLRITTACGPLLAPVRIVPTMCVTSGAPMPERDQGGLVYALPGGKRMGG